VLSDEDCATATGGGFGDSRQLEGEVGRVRHCSEEGDGGSRVVHRAMAACGEEREECEVEAVAPGKERDGAAATYRRWWRRSRTGAVRHRRLLRMEGRRQRCDPAVSASLSSMRGSSTQRERERDAAHQWQWRSMGSARPRWSGRHQTRMQWRGGGSAAHPDRLRRSNFGPEERLQTRGCRLRTRAVGRRLLHVANRQCDNHRPAQPIGRRRRPTLSQTCGPHSAAISRIENKPQN
jgi:hypothetical protein